MGLYECDAEVTIARLQATQDVNAVPSKDALAAWVAPMIEAAHTQGTKADGGKLRMDLLPVEALESLARRLTLGAEKYGPRNWESGIEYSRVYAALLRHLLAWWSGEDIDPDPIAKNSHHLEGVLINAAFLVTYVKRGMIDFDDRPSKHAAP